MKPLFIERNYVLKSDRLEDCIIWTIWSEQDLEEGEILLYGSNGEDFTVEKDKFWDLFREDDRA